MHAPHPGSPSTVRLALAWSGFVLLLTALLAIGFGQVATSFFLADDFNYLDIVSKARTLADGTATNVGWAYYRPVTALSFYLTYALWGKAATAYHLVGLAFHLLNACLVARVALQLANPDPATPTPWRAHLGAWFGGALFAVLPLHPEGVTWISARADPVCATGIFVCLSAWITWLRGTRTTTPLLICAAGYLFALFAKGSAMVLPAPLLLFALAYPRRPPHQRALALAGAAVLFAVYFWLRFAALGGFGGPPSDTGASAHLQIDLGNAARFTLDACLAMLMPAGTSLTAGAGLLALLYIAARHGALPHALRATWPLAACFLIQLAPVANLVQVDVESGTNTRFLYLPAMFFAAAVGVLAATVRAEAQRGAAVLVAACLLLAVHTRDLRRANVRWREAAAITTSLLDQMRELAQGKRYRYVLFYELPDNHRGVYVFRNGIEAAIRFFVDPALEFTPNGRIDRDTWIKGVAERRADPNAHPEVMLVRWDAETRQLITP